MSVKVLSWAWADSAADGPALLVLLAIADFAHDDGDGAWPSVPTLAAKARVSDRTVQRCIQRLVDLGELEVQANAGPNGVNMYRVLMNPGGERVTRSHPRQPVTPSDSREVVTPVTRSGDTGVTQTVKEPSLTVITQKDSTMPAKLTKADAVELLHLACTLDTRLKYTDARADEWAGSLYDLDPDLCKVAIRVHYRDSPWTVTLAQIRQKVKALNETRHHRQTQLLLRREWDEGEAKRDPEAAARGRQAVADALAERKSKRASA